MGRLEFTHSEIDELRTLVGELRRAEPTGRKRFAPRCARIGFYITDVSHDAGHGFTLSDFDLLVHRGTIRVDD